MQSNLYALMLLILCLVSTSLTYASLEDCEIESSLELGHQPALKIMSEMFNNKIEICFDRTELEKDFSVLASFKRFRREEVLAFVSLSCFNPAKIKNRSHEDLKTIVSYFMKDGKFVMGITEVDSRTYAIDLVRKKENDFGENDPIDPTKITIYPVAGALLSSSLYPNQADKRLHVIAGASVHAITTTLAFKFSQNSTLSLKQRRLLVENAGPVAGLAVGVIKEILYDARNRDKHTVDARDALATALGAGFIPRLRMSVDF